MRPALAVCVVVVLMVSNVGAFEEVHTFEFKDKNKTVHGVADFDAEANWMSHHIFSDDQGPGVTIARDHNKGMEVFRYNGEKVCYVRPIPAIVSSVWEFKSMLEIQEEHHFNMDLPRRRYIEFLQCTGKKAPLSRLGNVSYLCKGLPVFWLQEYRSPIDIAPGQTTEGVPRGEPEGSTRVKRVAGSRYRLTDNKCKSCTDCCGGAKRGSPGRHKRDLLAVEACTRTVWIKGCIIDDAGNAVPKKIESNNEKDETIPKKN